MIRYAIFGIFLLSACAQVVERQVLNPTEQQVDGIKQGVSRNFKDPDSALWRNIRVTRDTMSDGRQITLVCGQVNAKNSFGAYVGYTYFTGELRGEQYFPGIAPDVQSDWIAASICQ